MDNANIHMYKELQDMIHETGALLFFSAAVLTRPKSYRGRFFVTQALDSAARQYGISRKSTRSARGRHASVYEAEGRGRRKSVSTLRLQSKQPFD
jgi:hypothetical protein